MSFSPTIYYLRFPRMPNTLKVIIVVLKDASVEDVRQFIKVIKSNPKVSEVKVLDYPVP